MNTGPQTWQELLADLIQDPQERQRIAAELGVHPATISRWVNGVSTPRPQIMRRLPRILPEEFCESFASLVAEEFPDALTLEEMLPLPEDFYERVLHIYHSTPPTSHFQSMCEQILEQALAQLDPECQGTETIVIQCISEPEGTVQSLRDVLGKGADPHRSLAEEIVWQQIEELLHLSFDSEEE